MAKRRKIESIIQKSIVEDITTHFSPLHYTLHSTSLETPVYSCLLSSPLQLHKLLDFRELKEFATLLKRYRDDLPVREFLSKLKDLYGEQRRFLIPG